MRGCFKEFKENQELLNRFSIPQQINHLKDVHAATHQKLYTAVV